MQRIRYDAMTDESFEPQRRQIPLACPRCNRPTTEKPFCACGFDLYHGSTKLQKVGKCLFCEFHGKLSMEHVFGKWLSRSYNRPATSRVHTLRRPAVAAFFKESELIGNAEAVRSGKLYDDVVFNVCEQCNNGWMSRLHVEAGPLITSLANGNCAKFSPEEREVIGRWAVMVSLNLESRSRIWSTAQHQLDGLSSGAALSGWRVSIAKMADDAEAGNAFHRHLQFPIMGLNEPHKATSAWFVVEKVAFHVFGTWHEKVDGLLQMLCGVPEQFLPRRLWPQYDEPKAENTRPLPGMYLYQMQDQLLSWT